MSVKIQNIQPRKVVKFCIIFTRIIKQRPFSFDLSPSLLKLNLIKDNIHYLN